MKRAIVTGGSGLIGQAICAHLLRDGWEVASFDLKEGALGLQIHCDLSVNSAGIGLIFSSTMAGLSSTRSCDLMKPRWNSGTARSEAI